MSAEEFLLCPDGAVIDGVVQDGVAVHVRDGVIVGCTSPPATARATPPQRRLAGTLMPGLIDVQVNGAGGHNCDAPDHKALDAVARAVRRGGAQAFLPTLITAPIAQLVDRARGLVDWIENGAAADGAVPLGLHIEGPFLEVAGAHDESLFVDPTAERVDALLDACRGHLRLVTLAPARAGAAAAVARLRAAGVAVALGHAHDTAQLEACVEAGARGVTHLFNAMSGLHHRAPGVVGHALADPRLICSLILDGHHVDAVAARAAWRALGPDRLALISDAISAAGMPDGEYELGGTPVTLHDGVVRNRAGTLAGSALTMSAAAGFLLRHLPGTTAAEVAACGATTPARLLGIEATWGRIAPGRVARFSLLGAAGQVTAVGPGLPD